MNASVDSLLTIFRDPDGQLWELINNPTRATTDTQEAEAMSLIENGTLPTGNLKGEDHGASISLILDESDPGHGPRLHRHPYDETWVVIEGNLSFRSGDEQFAAGPGDIVIVPPDTPHKFTSDGPGRSKLVCIHANPTFDTEWLE